MYISKEIKSPFIHCSINLVSICFFQENKTAYKLRIFILVLLVLHFGCIFCKLDFDIIKKTETVQILNNKKSQS